MASSQQPDKAKPHVLLIPFPAQGHVNPLIRLAKALHMRSFHVTFVHTEHNHRRLLRSRGPGVVEEVPGFRFETIPDGLPLAELDGIQDIWKLCEATRRTCPGHVRELVERLSRTDGIPPVTCVTPTAPWAYLFFTTSACGFLAYLNFDQLVKRGYVPFKGNSVRLRDLLTFIRTTDANDIMVTINIKQCELDAPAADGILLNTFDDPEHTSLAAIRERLLNTITIGPLVSLSSYLPSLTSTAGWLRGVRQLRSITVVSTEQMVEFARDWPAPAARSCGVVRPDMVRDGGLPEGFTEEVARRGLIVEWCDQEAVLEHRATGGFLTHCGWNSTLESLRAGVPMVCWPFFAEQVTNCMYAREEWGVGVEMAQQAGREEVEAAVKMLMGDGAMLRNAAEWKEKAETAIMLGGSTHGNLERVVQAIRAWLIL
ncbi:hypothetical protein ZWY2020_054538 [Hordeum vulgare]|nr:hypothetical protein ZWY2020_054538 [Hordeum vulgare]